MKEISLRKKLRDAKTLKEGGKEGALKSLKYFRDAYKKDPSDARKKQLEDSLKMYKKKYGDKK